MSKYRRKLSFLTCHSSVSHQQDWSSFCLNYYQSLAFFTKIMITNTLAMHSAKFAQELTLNNHYCQHTCTISRDDGDDSTCQISCKWLNIYSLYNQNSYEVFSSKSGVQMSDERTCKSLLYSLRFHCMR